jgi:hypothetical protein
MFSLRVQKHHQLLLDRCLELEIEIMNRVLIKKPVEEFKVDLLIKYKNRLKRLN